MEAARLSRLPRREVLGREVVVAVDLRSRALGLSLLGLAQAGPGLLIPRCASVHSFGMRFDLDLFFLDAEGLVLGERWLPSRRFAFHRGAAAVLELPSARQGGESAGRRT